MIKMLTENLTIIHEGKKLPLSTDIIKNLKDLLLNGFENDSNMNWSHHYIEIVFVVGDNTYVYTLRTDDCVFKKQEILKRIDEKTVAFISGDRSLSKKSLLQYFSEDMCTQGLVETYEFVKGL